MEAEFCEDIHIYSLIVKVELREMCSHEVSRRSETLPLHYSQSKVAEAELRKEITPKQNCGEAELWEDIP